MEWPSSILTGFCCCFLHLGDISEKFIHASYDTLLFILNLTYQIYPRPFCRDVLNMHQKAFNSWPTKWRTDSREFDIGRGLGTEFQISMVLLSFLHFLLNPRVCFPVFFIPLFFESLLSTQRSRTSPVTRV